MKAKALPVTSFQVWEVLSAPRVPAEHTPSCRKESATHEHLSRYDLLSGVRLKTEKTETMAKRQGIFIFYFFDITPCFVGIRDSWTI